MHHSPTSIARICALAALAALITACNFGPAATPGPTDPPPTQPGPTPSPTPEPSPTFGADQIEHPTGATDVVLRMEVGGGFVPMNFFLTQSPQFTLYGDGTFIVKPQDDGSFDEPLPAWLEGQLDEGGIQALLSYALSTGRLANARESYDFPMIADAPSTIFTLNAGGMEKVVNVYALMEMAEPGPDQADRNGFSQLANVLNNFASEEGVGDLVEYEPVTYRVILFEAFGEPTGPVVEWPWDDLTPADFPGGDEPGGIRMMDAEHVAELMDVPNGGHIGIWVSDPDGNLVQVAVRPLLPDENPEA